ncbi:hypothetical protein KQI77_05885 [Clostridium sp. MSJ-8]|uniref:DUF5658 family protein n=1 Tax=Clostridium sp. MSJ-8 TaxID=2841510 RepID=UPI001C0F162A|nr:DUF5658 family protein [Clostridium sp. MSJ-8]MBU5487696.1 hypothetical protein [Clostridium sp. MSJ-8]
MLVKCIVLYILNVTDIIFTYKLLDTGEFIEANGIMNMIIPNKLITIIVKVFIVLFLLIYLYIRLKEADERQKKICNILITMLLIFYTLINVSHIYWMIKVL